MTLDDNNMLQADATLLAGFLILLTLLSFKGAGIARPRVSPVFPANISAEEVARRTQEFYQKMDNSMIDYLKAAKSQKNVKNTLSIVTIGGLLPFSVSAILIILGSIDFSAKIAMDFWAKIAMVIGLSYLIIAGVLMVRAYRKIQKQPAQSLVS
jgi:hypothetical protein